MAKHKDKNDRCTHPGAAGPCMPRVRDGRCIWCEIEIVALMIDIKIEEAVKARRDDDG